MRRPSRGRSIFAAMLSSVLCPVMLYIGFMAEGIPPERALESAKGTVEWIERDRYSITFKLAGRDETFVYLSKGGAYGAVEGALLRGRQIAVEVAFDRGDPTGPSGRMTSHCRSIVSASPGRRCVPMPTWMRRGARTIVWRSGWAPCSASSRSCFSGKRTRMPREAAFADSAWSRFSRAVMRDRVGRCNVAIDRMREGKPWRGSCSE